MENAQKDDKDIWNDIVSRIKELRRQQGLSVYALAKKTGFTKGYLSHIENLRREPTVGTLLRIARALGVNITFLVGGEKSVEEEDSIVVVKRKDRQTIDSPIRSDNTVYESINHKMKDRLMDSYIVTTAFDFPENPGAHEGQELVFVLEGTQELVYDGKSRILEEGDCCYFDSSKPHYGKSIGKRMSKALVVFTAKS
jgi:transcriptional regulator with XRE-family HTH domain